MRPTALLLLLAALPAAAGPVRLKGGAKSEDALRRFVEGDAKLKARLHDAVRREQVFVAEARESDLRDAVSDSSVNDLPSAAQKSEGEKRRAILEVLPGMKTLSGPACATLASCPEPEMKIEVSDARNLPESLRRIVRPWMLLQQARGSEVEVSAADGAGDAALLVSLKGVSAPPLAVNVSPHLLGGFTVWIDKPEAAVELYDRARIDALYMKR